ncbi:MAG: hypothetical protein CMA59_01070 [Euryarchaeota archaeon]|nr:hypothetical protein [Euryarchaeota archaeon]
MLKHESLRKNWKINLSLLFFDAIIFRYEMYIFKYMISIFRFKHSPLFHSFNCYLPILSVFIMNNSWDMISLMYLIHCVSRIGPERVIIGYGMS